MIQPVLKVKGIYIDTYGYRRIKMWGHPYCDKQGYVPEHRLVVEESIKRYLLPEEDVHHINRNKLDNRIENLEILSKSDHRIKHNLEDNPFKGKIHTEETKRQMSKIAKKNGNGKWNLGRPRSEEVKKKISDGQKRRYAQL